MATPLLAPHGEYNMSNVERQMYKSADQSEAEQDDDVVLTTRGGYVRANQETNDQKEDKQIADAANDEGLGKAEKTWASRYANLRKFSAKEKADIENKYQDEIATMRAKLDETTPSGPLLTDEALQQFITDQPDAYNLVNSLIRRESAERDKEIAKLKNTLTEKDNESKRSTAEKALLRRHSNWEDITTSDAFHEWAASKSQKTQDEIYENPDDAGLLSEKIDFYLAETGSSGKTKNNNVNKKAAASLVPTNSGQSVKNSQGRVYKRSEIQNMTQGQYEALEDDLSLAIKEGRIING